MRGLFKYPIMTIEEKLRFFEATAKILFGCIVALLIVCCVLAVTITLLSNGK